VKAKAHKLGFPARHAKDRSHAFIEKVVFTPKQIEPARVPQEGDVFPVGIVVRKMDLDGQVGIVSLVGDRATPEPCVRHENCLPSRYSGSLGGDPTKGGQAKNLFI